MLMILSSSTATRFGGRKKCVIPKNVEWKGKPLSGIEWDKKRFQQRYPNSTVIETSQDKDTLLSRDYIINILHNEFRRSKISEFYIFYSGHGHTNGDWAPETIEYPSADRITLEEIADLWMTEKTSDIVRLYIFMDSCYSGKWCYRLKKLPFT